MNLLQSTERCKAMKVKVAQLDIRGAMEMKVIEQQNSLKMQAEVRIVKRYGAAFVSRID
jgi:hypothetical protein